MSILAKVRWGFRRLAATPSFLSFRHLPSSAEQMCQAPEQRSGGRPRFRSDNHRRGNYSGVFALQPRTPRPPGPPAVPSSRLAAARPLINQPAVRPPGEYCKSRFCGSLPRARGRRTDPHHCATLIQMHICQIGKKRTGKKNLTRRCR